MVTSAKKYWPGLCNDIYYCYIAALRAQIVSLSARLNELANWEAVDLSDRREYNLTSAQIDALEAEWQRHLQTPNSTKEG